MDLAGRQAPIKAAYKTDPDAAQITLTAQARHGETETACAVDIGRAIYDARRTRASAGRGRRRAAATCCWARWQPARRSPARWWRRHQESRSSGST
jgi:hypothetical protein